MIRRACRHSPVATAQARSVRVYRLEQSETALHHFLMTAPDAREGVEAFLEQRPPEWHGSVARDLPSGPP